MPFQSTVQDNQSTGLPGEYAKTGPQREVSGIIKSTNAAANVFSRAFSHVAASDTDVVAGGTGAFAGLLMHPKEHASLGTAVGTLEATLTIPSEVDASFGQMGIVFVTFATTANIGMDVHYDTQTGATAGQLYAVAEGATPAANRAAIPGAKVVQRNITTTGQIGVVQLTA